MFCLFKEKASGNSTRRSRILSSTRNCRLDGSRISGAIKREIMASQRPRTSKTHERLAKLINSYLRGTRLMQTCMRVYGLLLSLAFLTGCGGPQQNTATVFETFNPRKTVRDLMSKIPLNRRPKLPPRKILHRKDYKLLGDKVSLLMDFGEPVTLGSCSVFDINNWTCQDPIEGKVGFRKGKWLGGPNHISEWRGVKLECSNLWNYPSPWNKCYGRMKDYIFN